MPCVLQTLDVLFLHDRSGIIRRAHVLAFASDSFIVRYDIRCLYNFGRVTSRIEMLLGVRRSAGRAGADSATPDEERCGKTRTLHQQRRRAYQRREVDCPELGWHQCSREVRRTARRHPGSGDSDGWATRRACLGPRTLQPPHKRGLPLLPQMLKPHHMLLSASHPQPPSRMVLIFRWLFPGDFFRYSSVYISTKLLPKAH